MTPRDNVMQIMGAETAADAKQELELKISNYQTNAQKFLALHPNTAWHQGGWYTWNGRCWQTTTDEAMDALLYRFLDTAHYLTKDGDVLAEKPFPVTSKEVGNLTRALRASAAVDLQPPSWTDACSAEFLGLASDQLVLSNGMLNLKTRQLMAHDPALWTMTALPFEYVPGAECPMWEEFLGQVLAAEDIFVLQEWFGYCLTPDAEFHKILAAIGPRRSGKSTIVDRLCDLLGKANVTSMTADEWGREFALQDTIDKRLIRVSDARDDSGRGFSGAPVERMLTISGGDPVNIRVKYRGGVQRHPHGAKLVWVANELDRFNDTTGALAERFLILQTTQSFAGREDVGLPPRLRTELPGILNWALAGLERLQQAGRFTQTSGTAEARREMAIAGSTILEFVAECCQVDPAATTDKEPLYANYRMWCSDAGHHPMARISFFRKLKAAVPQVNLEFRPRQGNTDYKRLIQGVRLADPG